MSEWWGMGWYGSECGSVIAEWGRVSLMSHEVSGVYELFEMTNSLWYSAEVHNITFEVWIKGVGNEHGWALGTHAWSGWAPLHERWMRDRVSIGGEKFMIWTEVHNIRELKYVTVYMYMNASVSVRLSLYVCGWLSKTSTFLSVSVSAHVPLWFV